MKQESIKRGKFLQELREAQEMTQEELAEHMGMTAADITLMETGIKFPEDSETIEKLAFYLNVTKKELLSGDFSSTEDSNITVKNTTSPITSEQKKNFLLVVLSVLVFVIVIITLSSIKQDDRRDTYYLYFNNDNIVDNESKLTKSKKSYSLVLNELETVNNKDIKSITLYYKDNDDTDVIINGTNKDYELKQDKNNQYNLKDMTNEKIYLDVVYEDDTKDTTKVTLTTKYNYTVSDEREEVKHTVKKTSEYIIYNTQAMEANNSSNYDGSPLLAYGFKQSGNIYTKKTSKFAIEYYNSVFHLTIYRTGGNMKVERDARQALLKYTDNTKGRTVSVEMNPPAGKLNCDTYTCTSNTDYYKYLNELVSAIRG